MQMYFRIKHFDRYVGIFVILALALIVVKLVFIARGQKWFEKRYHYSVVFNKVPGLKPGTGVTISGMEVGNVKSLRLNPQSKVELILEILETYKDNIRQDSQATIVSSLLGAKTIEVTMGSPDQPPLPVGGTLRFPGAQGTDRYPERGRCQDSPQEAGRGSGKPEVRNRKTQ